MANYPLFLNIVYHPDPGGDPAHPAGPAPSGSGAGDPTANTSPTGGGGSLPGSDEGARGPKQGPVGNQGLKRRRGDPANHKQPCDCGHPNCGKNRIKSGSTIPPGSPPPPGPSRPPLQVLPPKVEEPNTHNSAPKVDLNFKSIGTAFAFLLGVILLIFGGSQQQITNEQKKNSEKAFDDLGRVYAGKLYENSHVSTVVNFITVHIAILAEHSGDKIINWIKNRKQPPKDGSMKPGERLDNKTTVL